MSPPITILIPTYNRSNLLQRSVDSCISQSYANIRIVIGNNASTDDTPKVLESYNGFRNVTVINRAINMGACANIHDLLVNHCNTKYALVMSDDDYFVDNHYIEDAVAMLERNSKLGFVHAEIAYESGDGTIRPNKHRSSPQFTEGRKFFENFGAETHDYAYLMTVIFRRDLAVSVNLYADPRIPHGDSLAWLMISTCADVGFVDRVVARYVMHGSNAITSLNIETWIDDIVFINKAYQHALTHTDWERSALDKWLYRQRRAYCGKVAGMLSSSPSWLQFFKHMIRLQRDHGFLKDLVLIKIAAKSAIKKLVGCL